MITDTTLLESPPWLIAASDRTAEISQPIAVNVGWWRTTLADRGRADEMFTDSGTLSRADILDIAAGGIDSRHEALAVLWAAFAWGEGRRVFRNPGRVRSVLADVDENSKRLLKAAKEPDPETAYRILFREIKYVGPAFFTKYLYFAGAGGRQCLILDSRVARTLHRDCGWESLRDGGGWPADTYGRYCALLARWAAEITESGTPTTADQLEYRLFMRGALTRTPRTN